MKRGPNMRDVCVALAVLVQCAASAAWAGDAGYPSRPIRWIVAFAAGGSLDRVARIVAPRLSEGLGQQVVIDNRPGAGGNLSAETAARANPDGHTLYVTSAALVVNVSLYRKLGYDPLKDFAPVTVLGAADNVLLAHPSLPAKTVGDLIALARQSPGRIDYASSGNGTSGHLAMELFMHLAAIKLTHIAYKSIAQAQADLVAGQIPLFFPTVPGALPFIRAGRVVALGVSGEKRSGALPTVPTLAEAGVRGYEASTWYPVLVPAGTPQAIVRRLNEQMIAVVRSPELARLLTAEGVEIVGSTPEYLAAHMRSELGKWAKVIQAAGIQVQ